MRARLLTLAAFAAFAALGGCVTASPAAPAERQFSYETAHTMPEGRWEVGLFKPLRWAVTDSVEVATHPLANAIYPNLLAKVHHVELDGWHLASEHTLSVPTPLLNTMKADSYLGGVMVLNGLLPWEARIPFMLASNNYVLVSADFLDGHVFTARLGVQIAVPFGDRFVPTVDYPVLYTRMAHFSDGFAVTGGLDLRGPIWGMLRYRVELDAWGLARDEGVWALEHGGLLALRTSDAFQIAVGYKLVAGEYPYGVDVHVLPVFDLVWAWD